MPSCWHPCVLHLREEVRESAKTAELEGGGSMTHLQQALVGHSLGTLGGQVDAGEVDGHAVDSRRLERVRGVPHRCCQHHLPLLAPKRHIQRWIHDSAMHVQPGAQRPFCMWWA